MRNEIERVRQICALPGRDCLLAALLLISSTAYALDAHLASGSARPGVSRLLAAAQSPAPGNSASPSDRQANEGDKDGFFALMGQLLNMANTVRSTPITEPGIPVQNVPGNWKVTMLRLGSGDTFVGTYELPPQYKFYVQTSRCKLKDKPASFFDPTVLGERETAATFYKANLSFYGENNLDYIQCTPGGVELTSDVNGGRETQILYTSEQRVLQHMSNWLLFLVRFRHDNPRSSDFLPFILDRYRQLLLSKSKDGNNKDVLDNIMLIDRTFPFEVFDQDIPLTADGRSQVREFFRTELYFCNKLKALSPDAASQIPRAEALMKRF